MIVKLINLIIILIMSDSDLKLPTGVKLPRLNFSLSLGTNRNTISTPKFIYDYDVGLL